MGLWKDLLGILGDSLSLGLAGVRLKDSSGNLLVRNAGDSADAAVTASKVNVSGDVLDVNSDAAGAGADWKYSIQRPSSGMSAAVVLTLPPTDGNASEVLTTDGNGVLTFQAAGVTGLCRKADTTALAFGAASPLALFTLPANAIIHAVTVFVRTAFNGAAPTMSVGIAGTTSKYMAATQVDLKTIGQYEVSPGLAASGSTESLIASYAADSSSAGAADIVVEYSVPA